MTGWSISDDPPRRMYRPGSRTACPATRRNLQAFFAASQGREARSSLLFNEGLQPLMDKGRLFLDAGELRGALDQIVFQDDVRSHTS